ncbi:MAG: hypothetical protein ACRDGI_08445 [Candidatus Limnocylindrales bacterium]
MEQPTAATDLVQRPEARECIETFEWRHLHFHVVTANPLTSDRVKTLQRAVRKVDRVGTFAEVVAMILGRHVQIRTVRPSPDIRFEVAH